MTILKDNHQRKHFDPKLELLFWNKSR